MSDSKHTIYGSLTALDREWTPMTDLRKEIEIAINRCSAENGSNTPDFILAQFLWECLNAFDRAVNERTACKCAEQSADVSTLNSMQKFYVYGVLDNAPHENEDAQAAVYLASDVDAELAKRDARIADMERALRRYAEFLSKL